jgi:competence protein ComEC
MPTIYLWTRAPVLRFLAAFVTGILLQYHFSLPPALVICCCLLAILWLILFSFLSVKTRFRLGISAGAAVQLLLVSVGGLVLYGADISRHPDWLGTKLSGNDEFLVRIEEPLQAKKNSYKCTATVLSIRSSGKQVRVKGSILIYFKKDSAAAYPEQGSLILFSRQPELIRKAGNPGSFDYREYCFYQGITHQVYLAPGQFSIAATGRRYSLPEFVAGCRLWVVKTLKKYIPGEKEQGLAEALLIGYKDDLDKDLVQAYSNTGVVHVIAISGLHLGLVYSLLLALTRWIPKSKNSAWLRMALILPGLWLFCLMAGAQPSVLRSAVLFTFLATGQALQKRNATFNSMALSAFVLLSYNPYWLWDAGFQLSYAAVVSILVFYRPIYTLLFFSHKLVDAVWKLVAISLAAQLLTLPVSVYHFHQFPVLFLLTNLVAVPLSSVLLMAEILLCTVAWVPWLGTWTGRISQELIWWMNTYIERLSRVSFGTWNSLYISVPQAVLLTVIISAGGYFLIRRQKLSGYITLIAVLGFVLLRSLSFIDKAKQCKLIIYQVPGQVAVELVAGNDCWFWGDKEVVKNEALLNFHLQPSHIQDRLCIKALIPSSVKSLKFLGRQIILANREFHPPQQLECDILILSGWTQLKPREAGHSIKASVIVCDGLVPAKTAELWRSACNKASIRFYDVRQNGAFVENLQPLPLPALNNQPD